MKHTNNTSSAANLWIGRMSLMVIALLFVGMANATTPQTYYWVGGASGSYTGATWSTTKGGTGTTRTADPGDILIFDGNSSGATVTLSNVSTETVSQIIIMRNSTFTNSAFVAGTNITVNFSSGAAVTVTNDIVVDKGCTFNDGGSTFIVGGNFVNGGTHSGTGKVQLTGSSSSTCMVYLLMNTAGGTYGDNSVSGSNYAAANVVFFGKLWVANTSNAYSVGDQVVSNGLLYNITAGSGTNGATAPTGYAVSQTIGNYTYAYAGIAAQATISAVTSGAANAFTTFFCGNGYVVSKYTGNRVTTYSVSTSTATALGSNSTATGGNYAAYLGKVVVGNIAGTVGANKNIELNTNNSNSSSSSQANDLYCIPQASTNTASGTANTPGGLTVSGALTFTKGFLYLRVPAYGISTVGLPASTLTITGTISCASTSGTTIGGLSGGTSTGSGAGGIVINNSTNTTFGSQVGTLLFEPSTSTTNGPSFNKITMTAGYVTLGTSISCGSNPGLVLNGGTIDDGGFVISLGNGFTGGATTGVQHVSQGLTGGLKYTGTAKTLGSASSALSIGNLILAGGVGTHTILSNMTINGTVFFSNSNMLSTNGFTLTMANGSGVNITNATGNFTTPTGTLKYGASASDKINISIGVTLTSGLELNPTTLTGKYGSLTVSGSSVTYTLAKAITLNDSLVISGSASIVNTNPNTITLANGSLISRSSTAATPISVAPIFGASSSERVNLRVSSTCTSGNEIQGTTGKVGTITVSGAVTYTLGTISGNNLSLDGITVNNASGILDAGTNSISENSAGTFSINNTGTIKTSNTGTTPLPTGKTWNGTIQYASTSGGHIVSATSYNNLKLSNGSGSLTNDANLNILGTLTTTAGGTLALGTFTLSTVAVTNGGIISTTCPTTTTATPIPAGLDYSGTSNAGSVQLLGSSAQTLPQATYGAVTLTNTAGVALGGSVTIGGTLSFGNSSTVLTVGTNTLTLNGAVTASGSNGNIDATNASASVVYSGSAAQTVNGGTFNGNINSLVLNKAGVGTASVLTLSQNLIVSGTLTLTKGKITTSTNSLRVNNSSTTAVTGAGIGSTAYINGPLKWSLASGTNTGTYLFPVGVFDGVTGDSLRSFQIVNPVLSATDSIVVSVTRPGVSFTAGSGSNLNSVSTSDYWSVGVSAGNTLSTSSTISLISAQAMGNSNDAIAVGTSNISGSSFTSLNSSATTPPIITSDLPLAAAQQYYFALGKYACGYCISSVVPTTPYSSTSQSAILATGYYGQQITITGTGMDLVASVKVNNSASITSFDSQSSTTITLKVPSDANLTGSVELTKVTTGDKISTSFNVLGYITNTAGDWNDVSPVIWLGGALPTTSGAPVVINNLITLNSTVSFAPTGLTIISGNKITFGSLGTLTVNGTFTNSGTIDQTAGGTLTFGSSATSVSLGTINNNTGSSGTILFNGTTTVSGTLPTFNNLTVGGTVTLTSSPTINGNLTYTSSSVSPLSQVPTYGSNATLVYKAARTVGGEWANFKTGAISALTIIAPGSGYTSLPTIAGTTGTGLSATASLGVATITVVGSSGYTSIPSVSITGGGGSGAAAVAYIKAGVLSISVTSNGSGYTSVPTVNVTGGGGALTSATASLGVFGVSVSAGGTGYNSTTCTVTGGGGSGASVVAIPVVGLGIPPNVTIDAGSGNTVTSAASSGRACSGTLNINSGTFLLNGGQIFMGSSSNGGTLQVNSGATLDLATVGIFSTGTLTNSTTNGTIRCGTNNTVAYQYPFPANLTWGGTIEYYAPTGNNTRITPGTFNNVNLDFGINNGIVLDNVTNSSATYTFNGTVTLNNASSTISTPNFTTVIFNGSNQAIPNNTIFYSLTLGSGTTFPSGTVSVQNNFNTSSVTSASQGTINFTGTHSQTIPAFNYNNLTISGASRSGNVTLASSGTIGVAGTLSHTATYTAPASLTTTGSTVNYNGTGASSLVALSYNNLTISGTRSGTPTITLPNGTVNVAGTFTTSQTGAVSYTTTGNTLNLNGSGTSTIASPFTHNILNITSGTLAVNAATTANGLATINSGATLSVGAAYTNTGGLTNNGTLQMTGGSVSVAPTYVGSASLVYKNTTTVGNEWGSGSTVGIGEPQVISFDAGSGTVTTPASLRTVIGDLSIASGTLAVGSGGLQVNGNVSNAGTLSLGGSLQVNGNWTDNGTFTPNSNSVTFGGSSASSITTPETFYNLQINNAAGVNLNNPVSVYSLTLTSGVLTTSSTNLLTITNTSNSGISGGSSSSYVDGPLKWNLPSNFSSVATYTYPVGKNGTYFKFALVNPTTGSGVISAKVEAFDAGSSGSVDGTLSGVNSEYWLLNTTGNYTGVGNVALTSASVANSSVVARSTGGNYSSLGGTTSSGTVTSRNTVGTGSTQYFSVGLIPGVSLGAITATSPTFSGQATATGYYGQTVTINGSGFTGSTTVKINGAAATVLTHTATQLTARVPAASTASGDLIVYDGLLSDTSSFTVLGYVTNTASDWNTTTTWLGSVVPSANSNVFVRHAITINGSVSNTPTNVSLISGSSITYGVSGSLTVNTALTNAGTITMAAGGTLNIKGTVSNTGSFAISAGTVVFSGTTAQTIPASTYYNLSVTNTGATVSAAGALVVNGQLNIASGATLDLGTSLLSGSMTSQIGTGTLLAGATSSTPIPSGVTWAGTLNYTSTSAQTVVAGTYKNLTVSGTRTGSVTFIASGTISVSGVFNPSVTFTSGAYVLTSNTFTFNGATGQTIPSLTYTNLTLANTATVTNTAAGVITVNGILTINSGVSLDMGTNQLLGAALTTSGTGTLLTQVAATPIPTGRTWSMNVAYNNSAGGQTVMAGTYNGSLNSAGTSGTNIVSGAIVVNGALLIGASHTLSISTYAMTTTSASTFDPSGISGTLITTNTGSAAYQFPANKTWGGKVIYGAASTLKLVPGVFNNLDLDNGGAVTSTAMNLDGIGGTSSTATFEVRGTLSMSVASAITTANNTTFKFTGTNQILPAASLTFFNVTFGTGTNLQTGTNLTIQNTFDRGTTTIINAGMITFSPVATSSATIAIPNIKYYSLTIGGSTTSTNTIGFSSASDVQVAGSFSLNSKYSYTISNNIKLLGTLQPVTNVSASISGTTITCSTAGLDVGMTVLGTGITATNTTITKVNSTLGTITVSSSATSGSTTLAFYPTLSLYEYGTGYTNAYSGTLTIPNCTFYSPVSSFTNLNGATIQNSGTWNIIGASFSNNMVITGSGIVRLANGTQGLSGIGTISNLTIDNSAIVTIGAGSMQSITGILKVNSGSLNTGTNGLTLKSTSIANTAVLDVVSGTITGTATVERFIPKGFRAYRDVSSGGVYNTSNTLFNTWQESGSYANNGYGMFITGKLDTIVKHNSVDGTSGLDHSLTGSPSAFYYKAGWDTVWNTNNEKLNPYQSYRVLVRGDRSFDLDTTKIIAIAGPLVLAMHNSTALRATGSLITGNVVFSRTGITNSVTNPTYNNATYGLNPAANSYTYIANPYACPIDFKHIYNNGGLVNVQPYYYYLDPTIGSTGAWVVYNAESNTSTKWGPNSNGEFIQSGQGFLIRDTSLGAPTLTITEADKSILSSSRTGVFGTNTSNSGLTINLMKLSGSSYMKMDAAVAVFGNKFSNGIGREDAGKMSNASDNLAIVESGKSLSIDGRLPATTSDVLPINLGQLSGTNYQLVINSSDFARNGVAPYIKDAYTNKTTALSSGVDTLSFTADTKVAATYQNRFSIVFKPTTLSVNSIIATATANGSVATIQWNTVGENGVDKFEVEKSTDAANYTSIIKQSAKNTATASYTATDKDVVSTTYYRIKAVSTDGTIAYSNIAKVTYNLQLKTYNLFPNPLTGKTLNVQLGNLVAGKYVVSIINTLGQNVSESTIAHAGGTGTHAINIDRTIATGVYNVVIRDVNSKAQVYQTTLSIQ